VRGDVEPALVSRAIFVAYWVRFPVIESVVFGQISKVIEELPKLLEFTQQDSRLRKLLRLAL
jgi:hypothetical protein